MHSTVTEWLDERVETLADLIPAGPKALFVGLHPSPISVAVGHYHQGRQGRKFWHRVWASGVLVADTDEFADDAAFRAGFGFTDLVKRPVAHADNLRPGELHHGALLFTNKIEYSGVDVVICTQVAVARALGCPVNGAGWIEDHHVAGARVFVMPAPYLGAASAAAAMMTLGPGLFSRRTLVG